MAKQKLTRKSYKRNIIVFGLMLFMGIALVSTGFATWVLSQGTQTEAGGNIEVGVVSDVALKISNLKYYKHYEVFGEDEERTEEFQVNDPKNDLTFNLEPMYGDDDGYVRWAGDTGAVNYAVMAITIEGEITPATSIGDFNVFFEVPKGISTLIEQKKIKFDDATEKYAVNEGNKKGLNIEVPEIGQSNEIFTPIEGGFKFAIRIGFEWGEFFEGENPSIYYEKEKNMPTIKDENGFTKADFATVKSVLQSLRMAINECSYVTFNENEYEIYKIDDVDYALINGKYHQITIEKNGDEITNVTVAKDPTKVEPKAPKFKISINVTAR